MKNKLKKRLLLSLVVAFLFSACQEPEVHREVSNKGTVASLARPVKTVGNGHRTIITTHTTWHSDTTYLIDGEVIVRGADLTIRPGTIIKGKKDTTPFPDQDILNSVLIIDVNAQIFAQGIPNNPIIFTSNEPPGQRNPGDWGGVILLGPDIVNQSSTYIEGIEDPLSYGGLGDRRPSGSGIMEYVRIEFAGTILQDGDETNGLTLAGIGANTTINHIQVSHSNDDSFEFFGGTVNAQFLVSWHCRDDDFDTDLGHTGVIQYAVSRRNNDFVSTESNGIESDNDGAGSVKLPLTNTLFANVTLIGPVELEGDGSEIDRIRPQVFNAGMLVRRASGTSVSNSIYTAWPRGTEMRRDSTARNFLAPINLSDTLRLEGITVGLPSLGGSQFITTDMISIVSQFTIDRYLEVGNNTVAQAVNPFSNVASIVGLQNQAFGTGTPSSISTDPPGIPNFTLVPGDVNLVNANTLQPSAILRGLVQESFRGAFDEDGIVSGGNWFFDDGWLEFDPQNTLYH